jgi:hypothetical protein
VCVTFAPEAMDFEAEDPQLDGQGLMFLAAYDTPFPDQGPGPEDDVPPIVSTIFPPPSGPTPSLVGVDKLPTLRLEGLPAKVYLRALFFDNLEALENQNVSWGVWLGGFDTSVGLQEALPLNALELKPGQGAAVTMPLVALRRLEVSVKLGGGVKPLDDASGPFRWFAFADPSLQQNEPLFGLSPERCLSLGGGNEATVRGFVIGGGDRHLLGVLNDFNQGDLLSGGSLANLKNGGGLEVAGGKISLGPKEYRRSAAIDLSLLVPLPPGAQPAPYSCP